MNAAVAPLRTVWAERVTRRTRLRTAGTQHAAVRPARQLVALASVLIVGFAGCGDDGDESLMTATTILPTSTTTLAPATTTTSGSTSTSRAPSGPTVAVTVDGRPVALQRACRGVDGAIVAIATTGRRIILVREEGLALRIGTEGGTFAETGQVRTTTAGQGTRYQGTILVEGQPTAVTIDIAGEPALSPC